MAIRQELEILGCRTFVCPNLKIIDEKCKELHLRKDTIEKAKDLALQYFKKTYKSPRYSSAKHLLASFVYIAVKLKCEKRYHYEIEEAFGTNHVTINKWYHDIVETLDIEVDDECKESPNLERIDKIGEALHLNSKTIKRAKDLIMEYVEKKIPRPIYINSLFPAFIYLASIIENERRRQIDIAMTLNVSETFISKWYKDIINTLSIRIICSGKDGHTLKVLK
ncbi:MAG: hypothetical protein Q8P40_14875 [Nitrospirota bacterium]|nr:hypothetical protein [Nitrospirota bacterium]